MSNSGIVGPDGQPLPGSQDQQNVSMTPQQFCSGVISAYVNNMMQNGVDPFNALVEMGNQVPETMIAMVKSQTNLVSPAKEPLEFLLQSLSDTMRHYGFRFVFKFEHTGEEPEEKEEQDGTEFTDTTGEIQGSSNQENEGGTEEPRSTSPSS